MESAKAAVAVVKARKVASDDMIGLFIVFPCLFYLFYTSKILGLYLPEAQIHTKSPPIETTEKANA